MPTSLGHFPEGDKWAFDDSVTKVFNDMLERSIPQYTVMRKAVLDLAIHYAQGGSTILDLGCSRGESIAPLVQLFWGSTIHFDGVEVSPSMLQSCRARFEDEIQLNRVTIHDLDLRHEFPDVEPSVTLSVFTLQFIPIEYRQRVVQRVYDSMKPGGAFLLVEKILGYNADIDDKMVQIYYQLKGSNGYSEEEIQRKRLSLEGVLVPVTARWNEEMLESAGFKQVDCFWRWMNFAGWIAVK